MADHNHLGNHSASNPQKNRPLDTAHPSLSFDECTQLVQFLLAIPSMANEASRTTIIDQLPAEIKTNVAYNSVPRLHVFNLIDTCLNYSNGIHELTKRLQFFEGDSIPMA